jgi:hypothetical protein
MNQKLDISQRRLHKLHLLMKILKLSIGLNTEEHTSRMKNGIKLKRLKNKLLTESRILKVQNF